MLGRLFAPHWVWPVLSAVLTVAFGALAAMDRKLPAGVVAVLAATLGLWNGSWNGIELARSGAAAFGTGLGIACAVFVVAALAGALAAAGRALWARTAVRVAGSWIAAAGLFMMGWALR
jgi:urease accessory protein